MRRAAPVLLLLPRWPSATRAGQVQLSTARLPALPVEVWVDADGRPARVRDEAAVPSLQGGSGP